MMLLKQLILFNLSFSLEVQAGGTDSGCPKTLSGGYLLVFVKFLCKRNPKMKAKKFKTYISILAIAN